MIGAFFVAISVFNFHFQFPFPVSSFCFISISCFSIRPVRHETMIGIWSDSLHPLWESGQQDYLCVTAFYLPDVTWHHSMWLNLPCLLPLYMQIHLATWLFKVFTQVQAGRFYHTRDTNVFLGRREGYDKSLYLSNKENLSHCYKIYVLAQHFRGGVIINMPLKYIYNPLKENNDGKLKLVWWHAFFFPDEIVSTSLGKLLFLLIWTCASSYFTPN